MIVGRNGPSPNTEFAIYKAHARPRYRARQSALVVKAVGNQQPIPAFHFIYNDTSHRPVDHARVDYDLLRRWCQRFTAPEYNKHNPKNVAEFPRLVIDCSTRDLVPTSADCEYFALSYVWGAASAQPSLSVANGLPTRLPATVEDAMTVVAELGFRYLWVDRYCLDQSNKAEFAAQLNGMAGIYRNAVATIIAAAGPDADYGLPGVGQRTRTKQLSVSIGDYTLWSSMADPRNLVTQSMWITRAWTYQEGVCSDNWLAFTDEQVMYHRANRSLLIHERGWEVSCEAFPDGGLGAADPHCPLQKMFDNLEGDPGKLHQHINRYLSRQLSYQSDTLNGMLGILKRCGKGPYPINHYCGIPLLGPLEIYRLVTPRATDRHYTLTDALLVGLLWNTDGWETSGAGRRRPGFPSWSWTGWYGSYGRPYDSLLKYGLFSGSEIEPGVSVFRNGRLVDWEKMCYAKDWDPYEDASLLPQELYIRAPTILVNVSKAPEPSLGVSCREVDRPRSIKWFCTKLSDDESQVLLVRVHIVDAVIEANLAGSAVVPLKAVLIRKANQLEDCQPRFGKKHGLRCCAILVQEGNDGATKAGMLAFTQGSYLLHQEHQIPHDVDKYRGPEEDQSDASESKDVACDVCQRAFQCFVTGWKEEVVKLI